MIVKCLEAEISRLKMAGGLQHSILHLGHHLEDGVQVLRHQLGLKFIAFCPTIGDFRPKTMRWSSFEG